MMLTPGTVTDHGAYRIAIAEDFQSDAIIVYVLGGTARRRTILRVVEAPEGQPRASFGEWYRWEEVPDAASPMMLEPTLKLPRDVLDAIVDARAQVRPADTGATEALNDTRTIRDRLLALIELTIQRQPTTATLETTLEPVKWEGWPHRDPPPA